MLDANPATIVIATTARSRPAGPAAAMTTGKAASYRLAATATPMSANTVYSCQTSRTCDHPTTATTPRTAPADMRSRPPCRSSQRPTGTAATAAATTDVVYAPVTTAGDTPRSPAIGGRRTANAYDRTPYPTVCVSASTATSRRTPR